MSPGGSGEPPGGAAPSGESHYAHGYHSRRHANLIEDDRYFAARAEASAHLYFTADERRRSRVFEYGCGIGQGIAALGQAAGWDVSPEARAACRRRGLTVYDRLEDVPRAAWDVVLCRHVLEHLEDPLAALQAMRALLAPSGELRVIVPRERHRRSAFEPDLNQHLYCWNFRALNNLLARAGYEVRSNRYVYAWGYGVLLPVRRWLGRRPYQLGARVGGRLARAGELLATATVSR